MKKIVVPELVQCNHSIRHFLIDHFSLAFSLCLFSFRFCLSSLLRSTRSLVSLVDFIFTLFFPFFSFQSFVYLFFCLYFSLCSPLYSRSNYAYYSPPHESQMWSTSAPLTPNSDDYGSPKSGLPGGLPGFQRITSSAVHYTPTGRPTPQYYGSHVS